MEKKIIALLMSVIMCLSLMPAAIFAENEAEALEEIPTAVEDVAEVADAAEDEEPVAETEAENETEENAYYFSTFEELKEICSKTSEYDGSVDKAYFTGESITISEDITIPKALCIEYGDAAVSVAPGVVVKNDSVAINISGQLSVQGQIENNGGIFLDGFNTHTGLENIVMSNPGGGHIEFSYAAGNYETLKEALDLANAASFAPMSSWGGNGNVHYAINANFDGELPEDFYIAEAVSVLFSSSFKITSGCTLTVDGTLVAEGSLSVYGTLIINSQLYGKTTEIYGTVKNNGLMQVYRYGTMTLSSGGIYGGNGIIRIVKEDAGQDPFVYLPGFNSENFELVESYNFTDELHYIGDKTKLSAPVDLTWSKTVDSVGNVYPRSGSMLWTVTDTASTASTLELYKVGNDSPIKTVTVRNNAGYGKSFVTERDSKDDEVNLESGDYYFRVRANAPEDSEYTDSSWVVSDVWTYTAPEAQISKATSVHMADNYGYFTIPDGEPDIVGYCVEFYRADEMDGAYSCVFSTMLQKYDTFYRSGSTYYVLPESDGSKRGYSEPGYYTFRVRLLSADITAARDGAWSETSAPVYIGEYPAPMYGNIYFSTFEELKEICSKEYDDEYLFGHNASFTGDELIINEDITIPENLTVAFDGHVMITGGATLTNNGWLDIFNETECDIKDSSRIANHGTIRFLSFTKHAGLYDKIENFGSGKIFFYLCIFPNQDDLLKEYLTQAQEFNAPYSWKGNYTIRFDIMNSPEITEDLDISAEMEFNVWNNLTVAEGCKLNVEGELWLSGQDNVINGTLNNNGIVYLMRANTKLTFTDNAQYYPSYGEILVLKEAAEDPLDMLPGLTSTKSLWASCSVSEKQRDFNDVWAIHTVWGIEDHYSAKNFDELKELCSQTFSKLTDVNYSGKLLYIREDIVIPENLTLTVGSDTMVVPAGVTLTNKSYISHSNPLIIEGKIENYGEINLFDLHLNEDYYDKIENFDNGYVLFYLLSFDREEYEADLSGVRNFAAPDSWHGSYSFIMDVIYDIIVDGDFEIRDRLSFSPWHDFDVSEGSNLTINGELSLSHTFSHNGRQLKCNVINNGKLTIYGCKLIFTEEASYSGNGVIEVRKYGFESPFDAIDGLDMDGFEIISEDDESWILGRVCKHVADDGRVEKAATCTEDGLMVYSCVSCGEKLSEEIIPAAGHEWDDGEVTKRPTATKTGIRTYHCNNCDATRTEEIPTVTDTVIGGIRDTVKNIISWIKGLLP